MLDLEVLGYIAGGAVFAAFWMRDMIPLRLIGIASNLLFLAYGLYGELVPILVLHGCLLPLNLVRLWQAVSLHRRIRQIAHADFQVEALLPFMTESTLPAGEYLFRKGDVAENIFYLAEGRARIPELDAQIGPGSLVGEIALFTPTRQRTQSVRCVDDCVLLKIDRDEVLRLFAHNPEFGLYLLKMIVDRLLANAGHQPAPGKSGAATDLATSNA